MSPHSESALPLTNRSRISKKVSKQSFQKGKAKVSRLIGLMKAIVHLKTAPVSMNKKGLILDNVIPVLILIKKTKFTFHTFWQNFYCISCWLIWLLRASMLIHMYVRIRIMHVFVYACGTSCTATFFGVCVYKHTRAHLYTPGCAALCLYAFLYVQACVHVCTLRASLVCACTCAFMNSSVCPKSVFQEMPKGWQNSKLKHSI